MNYLAHCFLAQPNRYSLMGNLLGDFIKGADLANLPEPVLLGLENHRLVDRFTDANPALPPLKAALSPMRRRFSGLISDVVFDYFLQKHWRQFSDQAIDDFVEHVYAELLVVQDLMHEPMRRVVVMLCTHNGLRANRTQQGLARTLDRLSQRIRFKNELAGAIVEVKANFAAYEEAFLQLFPELIEHVNQQAIEKGGVA